VFIGKESMKSKSRGRELVIRMGGGEFQGRLVDYVYEAIETDAERFKNKNDLVVGIDEWA
jgi:hypothetical protein